MRSSRNGHESPKGNFSPPRASRSLQERQTPERYRQLNSRDSFFPDAQNRRRRLNGCGRVIEEKKRPLRKETELSKDTT
ncbi:hypothetical protein NDU88_003956 [Pleurodeles waltl]|uniref:Uncharacterized protein n=1 Tax=Pleurodeles waltl TaxID=8319 RepID=A0AAV7REE1_PLEWA|nr:hypothetical protein NDU88_003956 [Pleurodeles waltl]